MGPFSFHVYTRKKGNIETGALLAFIAYSVPRTIEACQTGKFAEGWIIKTNGTQKPSQTFSFWRDFTQRFQNVTKTIIPGNTLLAKIKKNFSNQNVLA